MMLRSGDLNLNRSVQAFGDSAMERLKQSMLQHELIFRNQVCELHRLYWTQNNLMNELRMKGFDPHAPSSSSWLSKVSEDKKNAFSVSFRAKESLLARNVGALEEFEGKSADLLNNHQRDFSLHLPADDFIRGTGEVPEFYHQDIGVAQVNLAVDSGFEEVIVKNSMLHSASNFRCKEVIDLEDSVELEFHEVTNEVSSGGFRAPMLKGAGVFGTQASVPCGQVSSSIIENDLRRMPSVIHLSEEHGGRFQEQKPALSYVGIGESCVDASANQPRKKQQTRPMLFDLNVPHEDECFHDLKGMLEQGKSNSCPAETSFAPTNLVSSDTAAKTSCENRAIWLICHEKDSKADCSPDSKLACKTTNNNDDSKNRDNFKVLVSGCQIQAECCEGSTDSSDQGFISINALSISSLGLCKQGKDNVDSSTDKLQFSSHSDIKWQESNITSSNSTNLPQTVNRDSVTKPANHEGSEEDTSSSHAIAQDEVEPSRKFLTGCNSHGISRKNVSSSQGKSAGDPAAFSNTDDSVTTQLNSSQNEGSLIGKLKPEEWDGTIAVAAEALMGISLGCSAIPMEQPDGIPLLELESDDIMSNLPQYSSDSFECMTLQLSEVQSEDRLTMTEPSSVNERGKNERGLRLRRGRGFRDFQQEILPGLVTLTRQEICDDLHNIGYKLRRNTSRNARDNWFVPVRSRRSKLYSGRRRRLTSP